MREDELERLRINLWSTISISKSSRITNLSFPLSIEIDDTSTFWKAEPSINRTPRGITIDWSEESENASDSIRVNREFDSNDTSSSE
jgi:hypothetical protein